MPKCTIDGKEIEVAPGTTVLQAALDQGIHLQYFCWHPDLPVDGNCRTCMVEIEKMPKLQIGCNTAITDGMVIHTASARAREAQRTALEFLLVNHPIDCPVCDQAGECYLQDNYMRYGLYDSKIELESKVHKRKVVDIGKIMLDAERCVLCSRCLRFESQVTGTNLLQFVNRGDHTQITTFDMGKVDHDYAGNLHDVCPVGALLDKDFRFKMRVWFLKEYESVCPGCSTGCNIYVDERDGSVQRLRARRNADVNKSWICDPGRYHYKQIGVVERVSGARARTPAGWQAATVSAALDKVADALRAAGTASAFLATPQGSHEELFAFKKLAEAAGGKLDFRVGNPQDKLHVRIDHVLQRADRNPNTRGCLDQGLARDGVEAILAACRSGAVKALVLQGPELLRTPEAVDAIANVPFVAVMATHEGPELDRASVVLPAAMWAETSGSFTNFAGRVQRFNAAVPPPGDATSRLELAAGLLSRLGKPLASDQSRDVFALVAEATPGYEGLDYRKIGGQGVPTANAGAAEPAFGGAALLQETHV
jgi:NADH-quinone oxidoreductase subunit G